MVQLLLLALWCLELTYGQPVVDPAMDHFIAINSSDNITYTCTVSSSRSVVWEVGRSQIRSQDQFDDIEDVGIFIKPSNTMSSVSNITISQMARVSVNSSEIQVLCLSVRGIDTITGDPYRVVTFRAPSAPSNLQLVPSDPTLSLEWKRPANVPIEVPVTYLVEINSTNGMGMNSRNVTSSTSLSVHFLEERLAPGECIMFEFFVSGSNEAGSGDLAMLVDTVPISPDVTNINRGLTVLRVNLQPLEVEISFPPVIPCSDNFPLLNYSIAINGVTARVLSSSETIPSPGDDVLRPTLSGSTQLPGVTLDSSFSLTVNACNIISCKESTPVSLNTTDVQTAEAIFCDNCLNRLFLRCSFAGNSQAQGCVVVLTLRGANMTERFDVTRSGSSGSLCTVAENQQEAYQSMEVFDLEANGNVGSLGLNIFSSVVDTEEEYIQLTGCRDPVDNTARIVGGVVGALLILVVIAVIATIITLCVMYGWCCTKLEFDDVVKIFKGDDEKDAEEESAVLLAEAADDPATAHKTTVAALGQAPPKAKHEKKRYVVLNTKHIKMCKDGTC